MPKKLIDLTNLQFGELKVVAKDLTKDVRTQSYWICKCSCGNLKSIRSDCLRKRNYTHCGCKSQLISIGNKFSLLTVVDTGKIGKRNVKFWTCKCDCGKIKEVRSTQLLTGKTRSCGCLVESFKRYKNPIKVGEIRPYFWNQIKRGAVSRDIEFNLEPIDIWTQWLIQDGKCVYSDILLILPKNARDKNIATASLDRIDSSKGYNINNIQWVHKDINKMKNNFTEKHFIKMCQLVSNNMIRVKYVL